MQHGHQVILLHQTDGLFGWLRGRLKKILFPPWFILEPNIDVLFGESLSRAMLEWLDAIIATSYTTAFWVDNLKVKKEKKYQFIQHYEDWDGDIGPLNRSWQLPIKRIVISRWLEEKAQELGSDTIDRVPNGIDHSVFRCIMPPFARNVDSILMMWHELPIKGGRIGLRSLLTVKERFPTITISMFGTSKRPSILPTWISYHRNPSRDTLVNLYNSHTLFLSPSKSEGWSLPPLEAMACGCCVVSANNLGVQEYAEDGRNARLVPIGSSEALADALSELIKDRDYRIYLATNGLGTAKQFTIAKSAEKLLSTLKASGT